MLLTFDAGSRDVCKVRRSRTNTPLQALTTTLNDPVFIEAAAGLALRMTRHPGTPEDKAAFGFRTSVARAPTSDEVRHLVALHDRATASFSADPGSADALLHHGRIDAGDADRGQLASWCVVANVLLNLDETLNKN